MSQLCSIAQNPIKRVCIDAETLFGTTLVSAAIPRAVVRSPAVIRTPVAMSAVINSWRWGSIVPVAAASTPVELSPAVTEPVIFRASRTAKVRAVSVTSITTAAGWRTTIGGARPLAIVVCHCGEAL